MRRGKGRVLRWCRVGFALGQCREGFEYVNGQGMSIGFGRVTLMDELSCPLSYSSFYSYYPICAYP